MELHADNWISLQLTDNTIDVLRVFNDSGKSGKQVKSLKVPINIPTSEFKCCI